MLGLLVMVALPLAIVAVPNTISVVSALLPPGVPTADMVRAHGLALPAMMLTVPFAALLVRRVPAAPVLVGGLTVLAVADVAGGFAGTPMLVGVLRALHGVGAGLLVPATLVAVRERPAPLRALWAATLAMSMLGAQALALWPLDDVAAWQVALQPYPLLTGIALALAAVYMMLRTSARGARSPEVAAGPGAPGRTPAAAHAEPGRRHGRTTTAAHADPTRHGLALTVVPAAGIAVLGFAISNAWPVPVVLLASLLALVALLAVASLGGARPAAYVMVAVGAVVLPTGAQVTNMELGGLG
ncbi:MFS transporter, partial [Spongiactinospora gelatinilytica]|uniref:MFS transporter n=1 Tax=Spongiactinospora gelatinilytica TaxID=2666298 RepID=UPI0011B93CF8